MAYELYEKYQELKTTVYNDLLLQRMIVSKEGKDLGDHALCICGYMRSCKSLYKHGDALM